MKNSKTSTKVSKKFYLTNYSVDELNKINNGLTVLIGYLPDKPPETELKSIHYVFHLKSDIQNIILNDLIEKAENKNIKVPKSHS